MISLKVEGMSCGHCVNTVTKMVHELDPNAAVKVDLSEEEVTVGSSRMEAREVAESIEKAGYTVYSKV